jgi:hypothetical protein
MKINVDAAISKNGGVAAVAAVARDDKGLFHDASAMVFNGMSESHSLQGRDSFGE